MARTDTLSALYPRIDRGTASRARDVLDFCDRIRAGVKAHQAIGLAFPKAVFGLTQFKGEPIDEGKPYRFGVPISNTGDGELRLALVPDCSCFTYDG
ncbi:MULTISPECIES: hypothetical protein, partial [Streptomyces]